MILKPDIEHVHDLTTWETLQTCRENVVVNWRWESFAVEIKRRMNSDYGMCTVRTQFIVMRNYILRSPAYVPYRLSYTYLNGPFYVMLANSKILVIIRRNQKYLVNYIG